MKNKDKQALSAYRNFSSINLKTFRQDGVYPIHPTIQNWFFPHDKENKIDSILEANLADAMARVAESNGMSANDLTHLFPAVLRMLKSESKWTK